jgi:pyruvate-formate lyase-activating enzyme
MNKHILTSSAQQTAHYGFYDRLTADFPSQINADLTEVCNLACIHCPHPAFEKSEHYGARYLDPALNKKMVDEVREYGKSSTRYIRYTGEGEPLIHPHGYEMIEYGVRNSGVYVTLTTNGTIMNEKRTRKLLDAGVHMVDISIDAFSPEVYAKIRVNGDLKVTRANVLRLIDWVRQSGAPTKVVVSYVEQDLNRHETASFEKFWKDSGASFVIVRRLHSNAGAIVPVANILRSSNAKKARRPCLYPWERILLTTRGLSFCPVDWTNSAYIADYRTTTIREVWTGAFYRALRQAHLDNEFSNHKFCGQCPDWVGTRWPSEGRAYADLIEDFRSSEDPVSA